MALDYMVRKAESFGMPGSLNVSYGNINGAHDGGSLFEGYISQLAGVWKSVISVAAGNEGDARHHARVRLENEPRQIRFVIGAGEKNLSLQMWKQYTDDFTVFIEAPDGTRK